MVLSKLKSCWFASLTVTDNKVVGLCGIFFSYLHHVPAGIEGVRIQLLGIHWEPSEAMRASGIAQHSMTSTKHNFMELNR